MAKWIALGGLLLPIDEIKGVQRKAQYQPDLLLGNHADARSRFVPQLTVNMLNDSYHSTDDESGELFEKLKKALEAV